MFRRCAYSFACLLVLVAPAKGASPHHLRGQLEQEPAVAEVTAKGNLITPRKQEPSWAQLSAQTSGPTPPPLAATGLGEVDEHPATSHHVSDEGSTTQLEKVTGFGEVHSSDATAAMGSGTAGVAGATATGAASATAAGKASQLPDVGFVSPPILPPPVPIKVLPPIVKPCQLKSCPPCVTHKTESDTIRVTCGTTTTGCDNCTSEPRLVVCPTKATWSSWTSSSGPAIWMNTGKVEAPVASTTVLSLPTPTTALRSHGNDATKAINRALSTTPRPPCPGLVICSPPCPGNPRPRPTPETLHVVQHVNILHPPPVPCNIIPQATRHAVTLVKYVKPTVTVIPPCPPCPTPCHVISKTVNAPGPYTTYGTVPSPLPNIVDPFPCNSSAGVVKCPPRPCPLYTTTPVVTR